MIDFKMLQLILFYFYLGSSYTAALLPQQIVPPVQQGQVIGGQVIQSQPIYGQVIQGQPIQGQPIQGQINQGQPIQGQIIQGHIIQGQPIQGQIIQGPIVQGPVIQRRVIQGQIVEGQGSTTDGKTTAPNNTAAIEAARVKMAELNKRIESLTLENSKLKGVVGVNNQLKSTNDSLNKEIEQLKNEYGALNEKLSALQKESMNTGNANDNGQKNQLIQLKTQFDSAIEKNQSISQQVDALTRKNTQLVQENTALKKSIDDGSNRSDMSGLQANLDAATTKLTEFETQNQTLRQDNDRLQGLLQTSSEENQKLNNSLSSLSEKYNQLQPEHQRALQENANLVERTTELSSQNEEYLASTDSMGAENIIHTESTKPSYRTNNEATIPDYSAMNSELKAKNAALTNQIAELQHDINQPGQTTATASSPIASLPSAIASTDSTSGKFDIRYWIIPFLLIGLGVGLYTFFMEEFRYEGKASRS